jgi:hypothetical protein
MPRSQVRRPGRGRHGGSDRVSMRARVLAARLCRGRPGRAAPLALAFRTQNAWRQTPGADRGRGFRYSSLCRPCRRRQAGCPSGQRERSVKPSASPTLVRTQHLPPPAQTTPDLLVSGRGLIVPWHGDARLDAAGSHEMRVTVPNTCQSLASRLLIVYSSSRGQVASSMRRLASDCCPERHLA